MSYLADMTLRLAGGLGELPEATRNVHAAYFKAAQQADGGFSGREGGSDLYYTGFALRGLALLGELNGSCADRAADYLRSRLAEQVAVIDLLSLIYAAALVELACDIDVFAASQPHWRDEVAAALEGLRRPDGGYAKGPEGQASSTYHTFLVAISLELIGVPLTDPERMAEFVLNQQRPDGGFVEITVMKRSGTNPTAAAVALLEITGRLSDAVRRNVIDFLTGMQTDEGGMRANTRIPIADLLSTFTGTLTLANLEALDGIDMPTALRFVESLQQAEGGFRGAEWDTGWDVEYTFYGLGSLALLSQ